MFNPQFKGYSRYCSFYVIKLCLLLVISLFSITTWSCKSSIEESNADWKEYNGDAARTHYSTLDQINKSTISRLRVAWTYASVDADSVLKGTQMQCNPIVVDGILYGVSADIQLFALDAATGKQLWKTNIPGNEGTLSRGVTYFEENGKSWLYWGAGSWLYCIDAQNGKLRNGFGENGRIDLLVGLARPGAGNYLRANTPNTIYKNLIIVGMRVAE